MTRNVSMTSAGAVGRWAGMLFDFPMSLLGVVGMTFVWSFNVFESAGLYAADAVRQNVIVILADDLGWSDTTLYGTTKFYQTPNKGLRGTPANRSN